MEPVNLHLWVTSTHALKTKFRPSNEGWGIALVIETTHGSCLNTNTWSGRSPQHVDVRVVKLHLVVPNPAGATLPGDEAGLAQSIGVQPCRRTHKRGRGGHLQRGFNGPIKWQPLKMQSLNYMTQRAVIIPLLVISGLNMQWNYHINSVRNIYRKWWHEVLQGQAQ